MTVQTTITFAAFLLEDKNLVALYEGKKNFTFNFSAFNGRHTDFNVAVGIEKKHFVERYRVALFHFVAEMVDIQKFAFFSTA